MSLNKFERNAISSKRFMTACCNRNTAIIRSCFISTHAISTQSARHQHDISSTSKGRQQHVISTKSPRHRHVIITPSAHHKHAVSIPSARHQHAISMYTRHQKACHTQRLHKRVSQEIRNNQISKAIYLTGSGQHRSG